MASGGGRKGGEKKITEFLTHPAVERRLASSTRNQAMVARVIGDWGQVIGVKPSLFTMPQCFGRQLEPQSKGRVFLDPFLKSPAIL
jgi:hypothetical protein